MRASKIRWRIRLLILLCASVFATGCGTLTVLVKNGDPVQLRADTKAKVWVRDANGERVESVAVLPAGWYCLPDTDE